ncbi:MAG: hypothetical protein B0D92_04260 [Spirochaeta sp. LUC14_002_19_P3]|nr:MAG: hypothetical protein B0D92_04260 [Spirochaeta sp. LUC14_002_19_P3]
MDKSLGICIGASMIKVAVIDENRRVIDTRIVSHDCHPQQALMSIFEDVNLKEYRYAAVTGRRFKELLNLTAITEPVAAEYALRYMPHRNCRALISLGAENFILYALNDQGSIINVQTGNKCASGTGEFFLQQIRRMDISPEEAIALAKDSEPYTVSGRCSVFCKSDCTHALNKGIPKGRVSAGLGNMIADKAIELLKSIEKNNIMIVGGVTKNDYVVGALRKHIDNLVIPEHAAVFEALGAAVYALEQQIPAGEELIFATDHCSFSSLPPLHSAEHLVNFRDSIREQPTVGDEYILGLDVGSTTTKAVLIRLRDETIAASVYLRTNGNPIAASRNCYRDILAQLPVEEGADVAESYKIVGLGVTGSGRQIAGLHAATDGIVNEIIAHAAGAAHFDPEVDTIFEIGGQDAKYTFLINGVPCDYAMNEACSAGTGSFLEESAKESLNINYLDIQDIAIKAQSPPNFNDQCAAFISSDIKNASHENISREDIVAGLVYSICMNYTNRVKGSRKVGNKVFMQGGVCYNRAVPLAMAQLIKKEIIVPPDPGLVGAFGVALEIKNRLESGMMKKGQFDLSELSEKEVEYGKSFICAGTSENCDRGCSINIIKISGKKYPFGGVCNKYYNQLHHLNIDPLPLDYIARRQKLLFERHSRCDSGKTIGLPKTLYTHVLFPLYYHFFTGLGYEVMLSDTVDPEGIKKTSSSFCFPVEIAHGMFENLVKKNPDFIFLPHVTRLYRPNTGSIREGNNCTCVLAQSEPYYIKSAFHKSIPKIISPVLDFYHGWESMKEEFIKIAQQLGCDKQTAETAYADGVQKQYDFYTAKKQLGKEILEKLQMEPNSIAVVVFGRPYNAFSGEGCMGIPRKFASRGVYVIPFDCLPYADEPTMENMNWALGHEIIQASRYVKRHSQLYGAFITNFSCGPDSFILGYFRDIMKTKPSLTLELDSHSADAGINTRIEAFLDIVNRSIRLKLQDSPEGEFSPARIVRNKGKHYYLTSEGRQVPLKSRRVKLLIPSMGRPISEFTAAAFRGIGFNAAAVERPTFETLMTGRAHSSCKECMPLIMTTASLVNHVKQRADDELSLYFMPSTGGNCRFAQYHVYIKGLIKKLKLKNTALLTLSAEQNYAGLGGFDQIHILRSIILADIMDDIGNALLVLPKDKHKAQQIFKAQWEKIIASLERGTDDIYHVLEEVAAKLAEIELTHTLAEAKKVLLSGEIYVRKDEFASGEVIKRLAAKGFIVKRAPVLEWTYYIDYISKNILHTHFTLRERLETFIKNTVEHHIEKRIKSTLAKSGLYEFEKIDIQQVFEAGKEFIDPRMTGEEILVIGSFFREVARHVHGVISIGPFACLPTRVCEAILNVESRVQDNFRIAHLDNADQLKAYHTLPFLSIEADGNPFPQVIEARIEAFSLQANRLYQQMPKKAG